MGVDFFGERVDYTVDDIIAVEGPRLPSSANAKKAFKMAFVLVGPPPRPINPNVLLKLQQIREAWPDFFEQSTGGRGQFDLTLRELD